MGFEIGLIDLHKTKQNYFFIIYLIVYYRHVKKHIKYCMAILVFSFCI